jgi:predicted aspartyl protease
LVPKISYYFAVRIPRRNTLVFIYLCFFLIFSGIWLIPRNTFAQSSAAVPRSLNAQSKSASLDLDHLVREKQYPELERQLPTDELSPTDCAYFEGILADRRNRPVEAIAVLEKILPGLRTSNPNRAATALRALASDYFMVGRYADASDAYSDLLQHFPGEFNHAEKQAFEDNLHTFELLRNAPPQTISGNRRFTVPLRRDTIGDIDVPLEIGDTKQWWIFDTGANISTISLTTAKRLGLPISKGKATTQSGATGTEVPLWTTVIPQLTFGGVIIHNAVAQVMEDKALDIDLGKNGHYQIQGILGYPVLQALGSFTVAGNDMAVSPKSQPSPRSTKMYVEELTPLIAATIEGHELLFSFDTGASSGSFTAKYLREFPRQFSSLKPRKSGAGGAGGTRFFKAYHLPRIDIALGSATATLNDVQVNTNDLGVGLLDQLYGNLGQSLLSPFRSYTIDFSRMQLSVGEDAK